MVHGPMEVTTWIDENERVMLNIFCGAGWELFGCRYTSSSRGLVGPPTAALITALPLLQHHLRVSVDHLLKLLHRESTDRLACWLRLEDARLFREGVDTLASWASRLLLQLHVQCTRELEGTILLQLVRSDVDDAFDHCLHILRLESASFGNRAVSLRRGHGTSGGLHRLHGFHCFHWGHCG
jgi:hypothetical protein